jgi:hypothetical protein
MNRQENRIAVAAEIEGLIEEILPVIVTDVSHAHSLPSGPGTPLPG